MRYPDSARLFLIAGALLGGLGVALGAFGAHGLTKLVDTHLLAVYNTAVLYQFLHTFALLFLGLWLRQGGPKSLLSWAGLLWLAGILMFSGSLYVYVFSGVHWLAMITPVGGLLFIAGWLMTAVAAWRRY